MNIIKNESIFKKYFDPIKDSFHRNSSDITDIILHGTGGGSSAQAILTWMLGGERAEEYKQGIALFHYEIDRSGDIYQIIPDEYWCYHSSSGHHDKCTIGIEMVNTDSNNAAPYTMLQYNSLCDMIKFLKDNYSITGIAGHGATKLKYSGSYKVCPGNLDWGLLERNFSMNKIENEMYSI